MTDADMIRMLRELRTILGLDTTEIREEHRPMYERLRRKLGFTDAPQD